MDNERLNIKKFKQYVLLGQLISVGLLILGFIFINQKQDSILQIAGWLFLAMGIVLSLYLIGVNSVLYGFTRIFPPLQ